MNFKLNISKIKRRVIIIKQSNYQTPMTRSITHFEDQNTKGQGHRGHWLTVFHT